MLRINILYAEIFRAWRVSGQYSVHLKHPRFGTPAPWNVNMNIQDTDTVKVNGWLETCRSAATSKGICHPCSGSCTRHICKANTFTLRFWSVVTIEYGNRSYLVTELCVASDNVQEPNQWESGCVSPRMKQRELDPLDKFELNLWWAYCVFSYMLLSRHQNVGQNREIKIANRSFENVSQFKYLGTTVTNRNLIQEEIKRRFNSGNACYHSVQGLLSSRLLSKNIKN
jgi:hypothetical protein